MLVRAPVVADAPDLGAVHVAAWQRAYRGGLVPDDHLDSLDAADRARVWEEALRNPPPSRTTRLLIEDDAGVIAGFVGVGPEDRRPDADIGEVYALYVHPVAWGGGFGRQLLEAGVRTLHQAGFREMVLWVHSGNMRARRFYERNGWHRDGADRQEVVMGVEVPEMRYRRLSHQR